MTRKLPRSWQEVSKTQDISWQDTENFLVLLPRNWRLLISLPRSPKKFLFFFPRSLKILQKFVNAVENFCRDPGKKCQKSKIFLGKKSKSFLGSLAKILDFFLVLLPKTRRNFLDFFPRSRRIYQNLAMLAKNNCQDLGKKSQKSKIILGKKSNFFGSLAEISETFDFLAKKSKSFRGFPSTILKNLVKICETCQK